MAFDLACLNTPVATFPVLPPKVLGYHLKKSPLPLIAVEERSVLSEWCRPVVSKKIDQKDCWWSIQKSHHRCFQNNPRSKIGFDRFTMTSCGVMSAASLQSAPPYLIGRKRLDKRMDMNYARQPVVIVRIANPNPNANTKQNTYSLFSRARYGR